jgi:hypothetical protein
MGRLITGVRGHFSGAMFPSTFLEMSLVKLAGFIVTLLALGAAHAAEIADAPIPEPNYVGIIIFLALMFGGGGWYMWKIMTKKPDNKDEQ